MAKALLASHEQKIPEELKVVQGARPADIAGCFLTYAATQPRITFNAALEAAPA